MKPEMIWVDVETTGLDEDHDALLEVGIVLTDRWGENIDEKSWIINDPGDKDYVETFLFRAPSNDYVIELHKKSGLWADWSKGTGLSLGDTESEILDWLGDRVDAPMTGAMGDKLPMCGSSILFDRLFLRRNMPELERFFHYRNVDVSAIKVIASMLNPRVVEFAPQAFDRHRPLDDLADSISLYKHFITEFFFITNEDAPRAF